MATTGLYSQHLNNRKKLHARNAVIALLLVLFAVLAAALVLSLTAPPIRRVVRYCRGEGEEDLP